MSCVTYAIFLEGHNHVIFQQRRQLLLKLRLWHCAQRGLRGAVRYILDIATASCNGFQNPPVGAPKKNGRLLRQGDSNDAQRNQRLPQHFVDWIALWTHYIIQIKTKQKQN